MAVHPRFPDLVRESLHSDVYWSSYDPSGYGDDASVVRPYPTEDSTRLLFNKNFKASIFDTFHSISSGGTLDSIEPDNSLPATNDRQLIYVVADSRRIIPFMSLASYLDIKSEERMQQAIKNSAIRNGEQEPTFESEIESIDDEAVYLGHGASDRRRIGRKVSLAMRAGYFLKKDEKTGLFAGIQTNNVLYPEIWKSTYPERFPDVPIGKVFSKNLLGTSDNVGRVVSAKILEVKTVRPTFANRGGSKSKKKADIKPALVTGKLGLKSI